MVSRTRLVTGAAAVVTAGSLAFAGASLAQADPSDDDAPTTAAQEQRGRGGRAHTEVTGDEATRVEKAVTEKDSSVTVQRVRKDADGAYHVMGTRGDARVMVEVSADLATVEVREGGPGPRGGHGPRRGHGGGGDHAHTQVTGEEATRVEKAVTEKDSSVTVQRVRKDADGAYHVMGTRGDARVMVEVSADLTTIEVRTGGPGACHGAGAGGRSTPSSEARTAPATVPSTGTDPTDVPDLAA